MVVWPLGVSMTISSTPPVARRLKPSAVQVRSQAPRIGLGAARPAHQSDGPRAGSPSSTTTAPTPSDSAWAATWPASTVLPEPGISETKATTRIALTVSSTSRGGQERRLEAPAIQARKERPPQARKSGKELKLRLIWT